MFGHHFTQRFSIIVQRVLELLHDRRACRSLALISADHTVVMRARVRTDVTIKSLRRCQQPHRKQGP